MTSRVYMVSMEIQRIIKEMGLLTLQKYVQDTSCFLITHEYTTKHADKVERMQSNFIRNLSYTASSSRTMIRIDERSHKYSLISDHQRVADDDTSNKRLSTLGRSFTMRDENVESKHYVYRIIFFTTVIRISLW
jgi:hypothetical protein